MKVQHISFIFLNKYRCCIYYCVRSYVMCFYCIEIGIHNVVSLATFGRRPIGNSAEMFTMLAEITNGTSVKQKV